MLIPPLLLNGPNRPLPPFKLNPNSNQAKELLLWYPGAPVDRGTGVTDYSGKNNNAVSTSLDFSRIVRADPQMRWSYDLFQANSPYAWAPFAYTPTLSVPYTPRSPMRYTHSCWVRVPSNISSFFRLYNRLIGGITLRLNNWGGPFTGYTGIIFDKWTHLCLVQSGNVQTFYVDGVQASQVSYSPGVFGLAFVPLANYFFPFRGNLTDCRVYDIDMSPAEVMQLYQPATRWELYAPTGLTLINPFDAAKAQWKCQSTFNLNQASFKAKLFMSCVSTMHIPSHAQMSASAVSTMTATGTLIEGSIRDSQMPIETIQAGFFPAGKTSQLPAEYVYTPVPTHGRGSQFAVEYIKRQKQMVIKCVATMTATGTLVNPPIRWLCVSTMTATGTKTGNQDGVPILFDCVATMTPTGTFNQYFAAQMSMGCVATMSPTGTLNQYFEAQSTMSCVATMTPTGTFNQYFEATATWQSVSTFTLNAHLIFAAKAHMACVSTMTASVFLVKYAQWLAECVARFRIVGGTIFNVPGKSRLGLRASSSRISELAASSSAQGEFIVHSSRTLSLRASS